MADPRTPRARAAGFTLVEMLVALSILTVGITTLLAALGDSMALRASADARLIAAQAVEELVHRVATGGVRRRADAVTDLDLELNLPAEIEVSGYAGMRLLPTLTESKDRFDVWLLTIRAVWQERGQPIEELFLRVLPRQLPLGARVQRFRSEVTTPNPR